jgi:hypothetical protein
MAGPCAQAPRSVDRRGASRTPDPPNRSFATFRQVAITSVKCGMANPKPTKSQTFDEARAKALTAAQLPEHFANFKAWYADVLEGLHANRNAGIPAFMITLPLLERYLRLKSGLTPKEDIDSTFRANLIDLFPALRDDQVAKNFWTVFRHGFLHQATLSGKTKAGDQLPAASLTHDIPDPVWIEPDGSFIVNPVSFSRAVVSAIEQYFPTFVGETSEAPPLLKVSERPAPSKPPYSVPDGQPTILSTSSRP